MQDRGPCLRVEEHAEGCCADDQEWKNAPDEHFQEFRLAPEFLHGSKKADIDCRNKRGQTAVRLLAQALLLRRIRRRERNQFCVVRNKVIQAVEVGRGKTK
jgi:hypothetical protein